MTPAERAAASREAQGLPPTVEDPATLGRVARLLSRRGDDDQDQGQAA